MASNLILPAAKSMAGQWTLTDKSNECTMIFSTQRLEWINSYKLSVLSDYSHDVLPQVPVAWRPAPDGIALLDSAGLAILFFPGKVNITGPKSGNLQEKYLRKERYNYPVSSVINLSSYQKGKW